MRKVLIWILILAGLSACSVPANGNSIVIGAIRDGFILSSEEIYAVSETGKSISISIPFRPISSALNPQWSPNRQWTVFQTYDSINSQIIITKWDGSEKTPLTNDTFYSGKEPAWSPDGKQIAGYFRHTTNQNGIYIVDISCILNEQECTPDYQLVTKIGGMPSWSPDGKQLAFWRDNQIFVVYIDAPEKVTRITPEDLVCLEPDWSPIADEIAMRCFVPFQGKNIFVVNSDGSNFRNITNSQSEDLMPTWSPDGTKIAFVSDRDDDLGKSIPSVGEGAYSNAVYIMNRDGTDVRRVSPYSNESIDWIDWLSP